MKIIQKIIMLHKKRNGICGNLLEPFFTVIRLIKQKLNVFGILYYTKVLNLKISL